ncbi:uncharacterized protein LOC102713619 [Oryza brachyantha]|nr:uncharacterized protein LOC102713619 [Oryza brachyantha]
MGLGRLHVWEAQAKGRVGLARCCVAHWCQRGRVTTTHSSPPREKNPIPNSPIRRGKKFRSGSASNPLPGAAAVARLLAGGRAGSTRLLRSSSPSREPGLRLRVALPDAVVGGFLLSLACYLLSSVVLVELTGGVGRAGARSGVGRSLRDCLVRSLVSVSTWRQCDAVAVLEVKMASRARWVSKYTKGLVDVLHENNIAHYRTQNGWRTDGWRKIVSDFNDRYPGAKFSKVQIQEHETQLKRDYKLVKSILQREGVSWDQNASMIKTTDEIWDDIIEEMPKARKYQTKSFPLLQSLELLFEGDIPEGEHNLMPSKPQFAVRNVAEGCNNMSTLPSIPGRPWGMVIASIDEGENNISILRRTPMLEAQGLDDLEILQNPTEEVLERPQHGAESAEPKPQNEPGHSSSCIEPQKDKRKKRKVPGIQQTMEAYLEFRMKQARLKEQTEKDGEPFSISRCIKALHTMADVSDQVKVLASDVFKDAANREIFLSYEPRLRAMWLKREVNRLI